MRASMLGMGVLLVGCGGHAAPDRPTRDSRNPPDPTTTDETAPEETAPTDTGLPGADPASCDAVTGPLAIVDGHYGYADLGDALAAARPAAEIVLCPGTYAGNFRPAGAVKLRAYAGRDVTVLEGAGDEVLLLTGGSEVVGLTIRGGDAAIGGGLRVTDGAVTVQDCTITANHAIYGGGLFVDAGSTAILVDTDIVGNSAEGGGGAAVGEYGTLDLTAGGTVTGNEALDYGGGVWLTGGALLGGIVSGNTLTAYDAPYYYGGDHAFPEAAFSGAGVAMSGYAAIVGAEITGNTGPDAGGVSVTGGPATVTDTSIHDNVAYALGGGVAVWGGDLVLDGATSVSANSAGQAGGGVVVVDGTLAGGEIAGNAASLRGGGLYVVSGSAAGAWVHDNTADAGGGLYALGHAQGTDLAIEANSAARGGGVAIGDGFGLAYPEDTRLTLTGGTIVRNTASEAGGGGYVSDGGVLALQDVDLGEGADDNAPADLQVGGADLAYGVGTTVTCGGDICAPG